MTDIVARLRQSYHLDSVQPDHILRVAVDEIERLRAECDELSAALAAGEAGPEPVARVRVHRTGGNVGIAWSAAAVNDYDSLPVLADGTLLYAAAPPQPAPVEVSDEMVCAAEYAHDEMREQRGLIGGFCRDAVPAMIRAALIAALEAKR